MEKVAERKRIAMVLSAAESGAYGEHHLIEHYGHLEASETRGRRCYLCQRIAGEKGIALQNDPAEPVVYTTVRLSRYRVDLLEQFALEYLLCVECAALIDAFALQVAPSLPLQQAS